MLRLNRRGTPKSANLNPALDAGRQRTLQFAANSTRFRCSFWITTAFCMLAIAQSLRGDLDVILERVGNPTWRPGEVHLFTSCMGANGECWYPLLDVIRPPEERTTPMDPPYDRVIADGMVEAGVHDSALYGPEDIDGGPGGITFAWTLLPDPGIIGRSVRADEGAVIPLDLLPLRTSMWLRREGRIIDGPSAFPSQWPPDELGQRDADGEPFDGLSWIQGFIGEHAGFFPQPNTNLLGGWEFGASLRDQTNNGWLIKVPFLVAPNVPGDFNNSGTLDADDIDILAAAIRDGVGDRHLDINEDGQVNLDDHSHWVHDSNHANTYFGDANLDGQFDSGDLTVVFQAGNYELDADASWAGGDWTGDGRFDTADLVAAFQDRGYELGPRTAVSAVPEPSCAILCWLGMTSLCRLRKRR